MNGNWGVRTSEMQDISCRCCCTVCRRPVFSAFSRHALVAMLMCALFTVHGADPALSMNGPAAASARPAPPRRPPPPPPATAGLPGGASKSVDWRLLLELTFAGRAPGGTSGARLASPRSFSSPRRSMFLLRPPARRSAPLFASAAG